MSCKTGIIRTIFILTLFLASTNTFGSSVDIFLKYFDGDTLPTTGIKDSTVTIGIPKELLDSVLAFQVNTEITYTQISQFRNPKAKTEFIAIWYKKRELDSINSVTEKFREQYQLAPEKRETLTGQILLNEEKCLLLNREMIDLFYSAQNLENLYWVQAPVSEKEELQKKNMEVADSLKRMLEEKQKTVNDTPPENIAVPIIEKPKPSNETALEEGVVYKIQIGAFSKEPPEWIKRIYKKLSLIRKISNYSDPNGVTVYTVGELRSYIDAVEMQKQVKLEGVRDASVAAYLKGKRITLEEARKLNNENVTKRENKKTNQSGNKKTK